MREENGGMWRAVESILSDLIESAGPQRAQALFNAAVPQWFSTDLYSTLIPEDADQLLNWVTRFSFISTLSRERTDFMMQPMERAIINDLFIEQAPDQYRAVHARVLDYWLTHPYGDPVVQARNLLYHRIIVDQDAARQELVDLFEHYANERQLGALEKLLQAADEAYSYLNKLGQPSRGLHELIVYMQARRVQLQGGWQESVELLEGLGAEVDPGLEPFVTRAYGYALAGQRDYAGAIDKFVDAQKQFEDSAAILGEEWSMVEQADTLIALGDAYIGLAEATISLDERRRRLESKWRFLQGIYYLLLSLPLAAYMTKAVGLRAWLPQLWSIWRDVDWVKADLYSQATRHFREAGHLLSKVDRPDKDIVADEKLADLYLSVGDAAEARMLYEQLLASKGLSDYRRSRIQVGFGQTQWLLGDEEAAQQALAGALPSLRYYADEELEAEAESVLGSIAVHSEEPETALRHFNRALDIYLNEESADLVAATNIAEQLDLMTENPALTSEAREAALLEAARVDERRYPVQQRYPLSRFFQQLFLFSVIVLGGIGLLNIINVDRTTIAPDIVFHATPLLDAAKGEPVLLVGTTTYAISDKSEILLGDNSEAELQIAQGIRTLVVENPRVRFVLAGLVIAFSGYLIAVTLIGILLLWRIDPQTVQNTRESSNVRLGENDISAGVEGVQKTIAFDDVSRYIVSNTSLFRQPITDSYLLLEKSTGEQVVVNGATAHYERVQRHIEERLPDTTERADLSHSLLFSLAGALLLVTVLLYLLVVIFGRLNQQSVYAPLAGSPYTGVTLLPYLLLGFLLPALWWFVWKPLQRRQKLDTFDWTPILLVVISIFIILSIVFITGLGYRLRLSTPDIYPALIVFSLLLAGVVALTVNAIKKQNKRGEQLPDDAAPEAVEDAGEQEKAAVPAGLSLIKRAEARARALPDLYRAILFLLLYVLLLIVALLAATYLFREVSAYHFWVQGEEILKEGNAQKDRGDPEWQETIGRSRDYYEEAINIAEWEPWHVLDDKTLADIYTSRAHASLILGIEELSQAARSGEADLSRLPHYQEAIASYEKAIELDRDSPEGYLWLGFAHHTGGSDEDARENYARAILYGGLAQDELQSWEYGASCPRDEDNGIYLKPEQLVKAFTGLGWIYFSEGDYDSAQANFLLASAYADCLDQEFVQEKSEAALGLGYTYYKNRQFDEAERTWLRAAEQDPDNAALLISLGTIYWRLGTLGEDYSVSGSDRCLQDALNDEEKLRAASLLEKSIDYLRQSAEVEGQFDADRAYTYRTIGQVQYLLRNCPGYDKYQVYQDAINSYTSAIDLNQEEPQYPEMRGRLAYAQWLNSPYSGPEAREPVVKALTDLTTALHLYDRTCPDPEFDTCRFYSAIKNAAVDGSLTRGNDLFNQGDYETAEGYYSLLTEHVPYIPEIYLAHLALGRVALAQGDNTQAVAWYEHGVPGAEEAGDRVALIEAWNNLLALQEKDQTIDLQPIQAIFDTLDFAYDVGESFQRGAASLRAEEIEEALDAYESGIEGALDLGNLDLIKRNLITVLYEPSGESRQAVLDLFGNKLPQMEEAATGDLAIEEAFDVAFMAWALGERELAARWYQEGIRRTAEFSSNNTNDAAIYRAGLRASRDDLFDYWQSGAPVDVDELIVLMDDYRQEQIETYPQLEDHALYWRYQGWFKYHVALKAFLAGGLEAARTVLESGQEDAAYAFPLDEAGNRFVFEYLNQGAWSWYFIERALERQAAGELEDAYDDFAAAVEAYPEVVTDSTARDELVDAAFDAGLLAFKLGRAEEALRWYELGVERADDYGIEDKIAEAREAVQDEEPVGNTAAALQEDILALLDSG